MIDITIITSIFKGGNHILGFLQNIVNQTVFDRCELYLLDANSPDNEYKTVKEFQKKYSNIKYERLDHDPGIYPCWNYMIQNSNSPYITNANLDDRLFNNCLEKHINFLNDNSNLDVAYCYNVLVEKENVTPEDLTGTQRIFTTGEFSIQNLLQANLPHNHPVWRRSIHDRFGLFSDEYVSGSDWDFWLKCAFGGVKMGLIKEPLGIYYKNPNGMSTKESNMQRNLQEVSDIRNKYLNLFRSNNV